MCSELQDEDVFYEQQISECGFTRVMYCGNNLGDLGDDKFHVVCNKLTQSSNWRNPFCLERARHHANHQKLVFLVGSI